MPEIKASYFSGNVQALDALGAERERIARERLRDVIAGFDGLSRLDWVPLDWDLQLTRVCFDLGGLEAVRAVNRRSFLLGVEGPLLRPLVGAAISLFGVSPRSILRFIARGWAVSTRDLGVVNIVRADERSGEISFDDLPPAALDLAWLEGFCGVEQGIFEVTRCKGETPSPTLVGASARYRLSWEKQ